MTEKYIKYNVDGREYDVPESSVSEFEKVYPTSTIKMKVDDRDYDVPLSNKEDFFKVYPNASFTFDSQSENKKEDDKPSWAETAVKGVGSSIVGATKGLYDAFLQGLSGYQYVHPMTGQHIKAEDFYDKEMADETSDVAGLSRKMGETAERLSREADPTGGEEGFVDLLMDGKFGTALQKGLYTAAESSVTTLSAINPYTAFINFVSMAGRNYADETLNNPDVPQWKRSAYAIGTAAFEQAVEKLADPISKYIGGGSGKKITEEGVKKLLKDISDEGADTIAKRIFKVIKSTGKDMLGEGTEEIITNFGNDAIGEALDAIEGDKDYGIRAQWEKLKESNPDADLWDFAKQKGKEYADSFIGGALSGAYMSGTMGSASEAVKHNADKKAREAFDQNRDLGNSMDYQNIYDVNDDVKESLDAAAQSFVDKNGESLLSAEFIESLSAEDAFNLSRRADISREQRVALSKLASTKAVQEGLTQKLDGRIENEINAHKILVEDTAENGKVITGTYDGREVYVRNAKVNKKGAVKLKTDKDGPVVVIDANTGEKFSVNSKDITNAASVNAEDWISGIENTYRENDAKLREVNRTTMGPKAKFKAIQQFNNTRILIDAGNGLAKVEVEKILPNGMVLIKGKKGDLGGQSELIMPADKFYDSISRDEEGNPVFVEALPQRTENAEATDETTQPDGVQNEDEIGNDFRDYTGPILVNGVPVEVEVSGQDDASDMVTYRYVNENGETKVGSMSISGFKDAVQKAKDYKSEPAPTTDTITTEDEVGGTETTDTTEVTADVPAEQTTTEPEEGAPLEPQSINWDELFERDKETFLVEFQNQFGDKAIPYLNGFVASAQSELDSLNKKKASNFNEGIANEELKAKLQNKIDSLNDMIARLSATEAPTAEPAQAESVQTENGFIIVDKVITNPEVIEMPNTPEGDANRIFLGEYNGKWEYGAEALMDNGSWGMTPTMRIEGARYDTREDAIKGAISFLENQWRDKRKEAGSNALDAFLEYVRNNYLANTSDSQGNSVPLGNEPNVENNGEQSKTSQKERNSRHRNANDSKGSNDTSDRGEDNATEERKTREKNKSRNKGLANKYPKRKGDATQQLLVDTFGLDSVTIPESSGILNTVYDFLMEMSRMLGISPKSIGNGGWLSIEALGEESENDAQYIFDYIDSDETVLSTSLRLKYSNLSGIAHEWWHSLAHALSFYNTGKSAKEVTELEGSEFTGRKEVFDAIYNILSAIDSSYHPERIKNLWYEPEAIEYFLESYEQAARAFEAYLYRKFAEANIHIDNAEYDDVDVQPTEYELDIISPAFDHLFNVLQEKDGKKDGTSILYHIAEQMASNSEAKKELGELVASWIENGGNFVVTDAKTIQKEIAENGADKLEGTDGAVYGFVKDGVIYLDPSLMNPNTPIHEYTHLWDNALMKLNPALWEKGKALLKQTPIWNEVINDPNYADIKDNEDLVASEVHSRLVGTKGAERLNQLEKEARAKGLTKGAKELSILGRLREWLNEATQWLKDAFSTWTKAEIEAVTLTDFLNMPLRDLANAKKLPKVGTITNANGDVVADADGKGQIQFSIRTWREGGRDYLVDWLESDKTLAEDEKADILARMDEFYENAQKYTDVYVPFGNWSEAAVKYDENGSPLMSVIKKNGDYSMNLDFSLVCKKRRPLNKILRALVNRNAFRNFTLREREIAEINWILQEYGFEVACALCFVDAKRYRVVGVADVFANLYNKFVKALAPEGVEIAHFNYSNNPNIESVENGLDTLSDEQLNWDAFDALEKKYKPTSVEGKVARFLRENPSQRRLVDATDFIEAEGFEAVMANNPTLLSLYNSKKGTGGPKASFGDVQYLNDILKKDGSFNVDKAYAVGGVRLQSFSDFMPHMYFDYMQLFAELAAKRLPAHAYTKEPLFAKIFGLSGIKINMSLVPAVAEGGIAPGLDADGNYAWAEPIKDKDGNVIQQGQSFPFDEAMAIQNAEGYSRNCGVIAVGISDEHIEKMLDDVNIPYIIPYHKSSLNAIVARMTNIDKYKDYTNYQNTRKADGTKLDKGTPDFNFNEYLRTHKDATPQQAAQAYLDWCRENNYKPKFSQFAYHPNYYKLLADFSVVDTTSGEYTPQGAVTMTFPTEQSTFGDVESLIQQGLQEDADLEAKMDNDIEKATDDVIERLTEISKEPKLKGKAYARHMASVADERMAKVKARAEESEDDGILSRSGEDIADVEAEKQAIKAKAIADGTFMKAPNGEPTNLKEEQWLTVRTSNFINWFGDWMNDPENASKVLDENGEPQVVYHGSPYGSITEFNRKGHSVSGLREFGTYFGTNKKLAQLYAYARQQAKGDIEKYEEEKARLDAIIFNDETDPRVALDAFDELDKLNESQRPKVYEVFLNIRNPKVFDAEQSNGWDGWHKLKQDVGYDIKYGVEAIEAIAGHNSAARMDQKYDGIIAKNMADVHHEEGLDELMGDVFLVFDETPANIKSATGNTTFDPDDPDIRYRGESNPITPEMDSEYLAAIEAGDMETAQRMVLEAAKLAMPNTKVVDENGNPLVVYHGTPYGKFTVFNDALKNTFAPKGTHWFADNKEIADTYSNEEGWTANVFLNLQNPAVIDANGNTWSNIPAEYEVYDGKDIDELFLTRDEALAFVRENGLDESMIEARGETETNIVVAKAMASGKYDGVIVKNVLDIGAESEVAEEQTTTDYVAFSPNQIKSAEAVSYDDAGNVIPLSQRFNPAKKDIRYRKGELQNDAVARLTGEPRLRAIERAVDKEAKTLGVSVTYKTREEMPKGHKNDKGYYNTKTGEIVVCTENATSVVDAVQTILHEAVAHKGLRKLMGDRFNEFISKVYDSLDAETKAKVDALADKHYKGNKAVAMEEYMATLAETEDFKNNSVWDKIKSIFERIINDILGRNDIKIGDNELRYILRASYNNMVNPRGMETISGWAKDTTMREELGINKASSPEILSRTGVDDVAFSTARDVYDELTFTSFVDILHEIQNATGAKAKLEAIKSGWRKIWNEFQMENQDAQQAVITGIEAIQKETGNIPIEDFENYLRAENQMSSRSRVEIDNYLKKYFAPIVDEINSMIDTIMENRGLDKKDKKKRAEVYAEIKTYLMAKHGLERNEYYQTHKTRNLTPREQGGYIKHAKDKYNSEVDAINADTTLSDAERQLKLREAKDAYDAAVIEIKTRQVPDVRDYSGLTALFGMDSKDFRMAEDEAQKLVDEFEKSLGRVDDLATGNIISQSRAIEGLWNRINAATHKTLRHSYESGLMSRAQYESVSRMFQFYIPLRGFDETTAEDVYEYANYNGNSFQPVQQKTSGRTSVAFDPIAVIMNMAQSEVIHGNNNRVKQALYHYVGNRPNSLLTIRDCWYVKDPNTGDFVEAYPNVAGGETWEDFENRMEALAENDEAVKRTKALDVKYRFQKPVNKNQHYIHLMINGVEHAIFVNGNPRLAEGVNGFADNAGAVVKAMKTANRTISQLFTNYNYKFGGKNFLRDFMFAEVMSVIKEGPRYALRFAHNWFKNNPVTIGALIYMYKNDKLDLSKENHRLFKEFIENGGQTGYVFIDELHKQKSRIEDAVKHMTKFGNANTNPVVKARVLLDIIQYVNECIELAARFNTYVTSRTTVENNGEVRSIQRSISDAKEVTTNFNRKGAQSGRGVIGGLASLMGSMVFFYNAAIQGIQVVKGTFHKHPAKTASALAFYTGLGFAIPFILSIFKGDDDDETYWNLPEYERKNNICIPFGKGKVTMTIPISPTLRDFYAVGVTLNDALFNKSVDKDATMVAMECAGHLAKAAIPANPLEGVASGFTPAESALLFATPDALDPVVEAILNKDFKGMPLEYRTTYNEGAPHYTKVVGKNNWKERVGKKLYKMGEDNLDSSLDVPLYFVEHIISSSTGGLGVLMNDVANLVTWAYPEKRLNDIPLARTIFSSNAKDDERFVNNIYWEMDEIYNKKVQVMSKLYGLTATEAFKAEEGKGEANLAKVYDAKAYPWMKRYYELNKEVDKMYKDIKKMPANTEADKEAKEIAEQNLFNKKREMVYELLEYEIE